MSYEDARIDLLGDLLKKSRLLSASSVKRCKGHTPLASAQESTDDSDEGEMYSLFVPPKTILPLQSPKPLQHWEGNAMMMSSSFDRASCELDEFYVQAKSFYMRTL